MTATSLTRFTRRLWVSLGVLALGLTVVTPNANAGPQTSPLLSELHGMVIEDGYMVPAHPNLATGELAALMAGDEGLDNREAFLRFTVPAIPAGATVLAVSLTLHQVGNSRSGSAKVYSVSDRWTAASLLGPSYPTHDRLLGRTAVQPTGQESDVELPISIVEGANSLDIAVKAVIGDASALAFASSQNSDPSLRPLLVVRYAASTSGCAVSALLVPSCGAWFGSTANQFGNESTPAEAVTRQESQLNRDLGIVHTYHVDAQNWPTPTEVALISDAAHPRLLLENWKPENGNTWAEVAAGAQDSLVDATAARITDRLGSTSFFLAIHHEPENELLGSGSGYEPKDYVAMYRHVVARLKADGVTHAVFVWNVMGFSGWGDQGLYPVLYPGDDVVDWIGYDPYSHAGKPLSGFTDGAGANFPGFYTWATATHAGKPLMLAEFGVESAVATERVTVFDTIAEQARSRPALKAFVYFNHEVDSVTGGKSYRLDDHPEVLAAARRAFSDPYFEPLTR